ncbi:unnamed protein product [Cladocopium goreaui]|uniref:Uncharacterized protein n=1 Tax=Cladocopium goreaui TaxID=2562237 RepID=A0A9P1C4Y9_9DINO|nr:unnamed protein product [Cladocopium goreaui]
MAEELDGAFREVADQGEDNLPNQPPPEELSRKAVENRLRRVMKPRADGSLLIPPEIVAQYKDLSTRDQVMALFEKKSKYGEGTLYWVEKKIKGNQKRTRRSMFEQMIESELDEEQELPSVDGPGLDFPDAPAASKSFAAPTPASAGGPDESEDDFSEDEGEDEQEAVMKSIKFPEVEGSKIASSAPLKSKMDEILKKLQAAEDAVNTEYGNGISNGFSKESNTPTAGGRGDDQLFECMAEALGEGARAPAMQRPLQKVTATHVKRVISGGERKAINAERDCQRKFRKKGLTVPVPIQAIKHEIDKNFLCTHWVKVSDWMKYLLSTFPGVLGSPTVGLESQCWAFWSMFKYKNPDHCIYKSGKNLARCLPLNLYGDEGRGPKRALFLEMSCETAFGIFPHKGGCSCNAELQKVPTSAIPHCVADSFGPEVAVAEGLSTNLKGHSYLTKHLIFGLPSYLYKEHEAILQKHLQLLSEDMCHLYETGIQLGESLWHGVLIGVKGDMKFHAETCCRFDRYHANLGKIADLMMCPFCHAGQQGMPFEELDDTPLWTNSMFATRPWPADDSPHLATIPYDSFGRQEAMFSLDPFHVSKVGLIRDVVGSLLVIMCRVGFFDTASDSRDINETEIIYTGISECQDIFHESVDELKRKVLQNIIGMHELLESHGLFLPRRVSTRTIGFRVIQRFFLKSRALFVRHRKKHGPGFLYDKNM